MWYSRRYILVVIGFLMWMKGYGQDAAFEFPGSITRSFLPDVYTAYGNKEVVKKINVYNTTFQDEYVERDDVVEISLLNNHSKQKVAEYRPSVEGYRQELYLMQLITDSSTLHYVYFTVWYKNGDEPFGFGPAYSGTMDSTHLNILFDHQYVMKHDERGYRLSPIRKSRRFSFVINELPKKSIKVNRIVLEEDNKIGGRKRIVFRVEEHLKDLSSLQFDRMEESITP